MKPLQATTPPGALSTTPRVLMIHGKPPWLAKEAATDSHTPAPARAVVGLALYRLSERVRPPADPPTSSREAGPAERLLADHPAVALHVLRQATRHAWLTLEIALAGTGLWEQVAPSLPTPQGNAFRQQMDALLDKLTLAGLETDSPQTRRACCEELRAARLRDTLSVDSVEAVKLRPRPEAEALADVAEQLRHLGLPQLARLASLRSPWGEPLLVGMVEHFLCRSFRAHPELGWDLPEASQVHSASSWRCLEQLSRLLEERGPALEAMLDRREEAAPAGPVAPADEEEVARLYHLGLTRHLNGDYQQAAAHFTAALKLAPTDPVLYAHRGDSYRLQCEYERALADFDVALRLTPSNPSVLVSRAIAYQLSGENERAVADCTAALALSPNNATAYRTRAAAHGELGALDPALADLTEAIRLAPEDNGARFQRGVLNTERRDYVQAIADLNRALELNPHHVAAYLHRGHAHRCRSDYASAVRDYSEVLRHHPDNVLAYSSRGLAYQLQGDPDRAIADYTETLRLEPGNAQAYYSRGVLYRGKGDLARARADLDEAVRREPENWAALYQRGKIALALGHFPEAVDDLTEALYLNPKLVVGLLSRALARDRLGLHADAVADATAAIDLDDNSAAARLVRGVVHAHARDYAAAAADLTEAIRLDPRFDLAYQERATAWTLQGEHDRALADCNQFLALDPGNAQAYACRSVVYHFKGDIPQALTDYTRALQIDPTRIMAGWNQALAERDRARATQRLADYIDGLRPEAPPAEAPPPVKFRIVLQPPGPEGAAPAGAAKPRTDLKAKPAAAEALPAANLPLAPSAPAERTGTTARQVDSVPAAVRTRGDGGVAKMEAVTPALAASEPAVSPQEGPAADATARVGAPAPAKPAVSKAKPRAAVPGPSKSGVLKAAAAQGRSNPALSAAKQQKKNPKATVQEEIVELTEADLASGGTTPSDEASELAVTEMLSDAADGQATAESAPPAAEPPTPALPPVACPTCRRPTIPSAALPGGRFRCGTCDKVILPVGVGGGTSLPQAAPVRAPAKRAAKRDEEEGDATGLLQRWGTKPTRLAGAAAAALFLLYFSSSWLFGTSDHVAVYPALGQAEFEGKPIPEASIYLEPIGSESNFPRPRAVVKADGTFALGTYGKEDGAPAGEYKVLVQWFKAPEKVEGEGSPRPRNLLPPRYARYETSGLTLQVMPGDNKLPPLKLKR